MRGGYRTKIFLATFSGAASVLLLASTLIAISLRRQTYDRIERALVNEAKLAAELLSHRTAVGSRTDLQDEARALASGIEARVTLIAAEGEVVGDSSQDPAGLALLENHASRPEVLDARQHGIGIASRPSATLGIDMLYVAATVRHPSIAIVRLALPLTEIDRQLLTIWRSALYALAFSVVGAFVMAWVASSVLVRRLDRLATGARRYAAGDVQTPPADYENDEIGTVSRVLDDAVRRLGQRAAELARDRALMEAVLAGMVEGVVVIDGDERVQLVNAAARRLLGIQGDVAGRHFLECVRHPAVASQLEAATRGDVESRAAPTTVSDDSRVFVARATPIAGASAPGAAKRPGEGGRGAVLVLHDITDLHRTDQIRRDFVANVSHELRTPLTAIRGSVEALGDEPLDPDDRRKFHEIIARQTARMERLVEDLLRLARLEGGQEPPTCSPCHVRDLFAEVAADLRPGIERKRQRIELSVDPSVQIVGADSQQLHDALRNLVENASLYSPADTVITLAARREKDWILITVADQGPGLPPSDLSRVFERFYRVDKARSREAGGTGLGLAIVKHIVERMDGSVRADNRPAGGAILTIQLPLREAGRTAET